MTIYMNINELAIAFKSYGLHLGSKVTGVCELQCCGLMNINEQVSNMIP